MKYFVFYSISGLEATPTYASDTVSSDKCVTTMVNNADVQVIDLSIKTRNPTERILTENNKKTPDDVKRPPACVLDQQPLKKKRKTSSRTSHPMDTPRNTTSARAMTVNRNLLTTLEGKGEVEDTENDTSYARKRKIEDLRHEMDAKLECRRDLEEHRMREEENRRRILAEKMKK